MWEKKVEELMTDMTLDDLCGQLINYNTVGEKWSLEEFEEIVKQTKPGAIFVSDTTKEKIKAYTDIVNKHTKVPVIVSADIENGPGCAIHSEVIMPEPMAWGAADDEALIEQAGIATAEISRENGIHWTFSPVVDINFNPDNPVTNIRAISDSPRQVAKIAKAYIRGMQKEGYLVAGCKHFPGDGVDNRNQHFCTTINSLSKEEWMESFGYVYQTLIEDGVSSVMVGHIALPAFEDEPDPVLGYKPGTLSYQLMTNLLKGKLEFDGCIVSDAMSMVGACAMTALDKLSVDFIKAGGDMVLFALPQDFTYIKDAVLDGSIPMERLKDAVRRVLTMKMKARLFENQDTLKEQITYSYDLQIIADKIGDKSIKIVRNTQGLLPLDLPKGSNILVLNIQKTELQRSHFSYVRYLDTVEEELKNRGFQVDNRTGISHYELEQIKNDYACILINCKISSRDYLGGTLRANWDQIMVFWRGVVLDHPCVIFSSFGDPYKLYDFPFLKTYINTFSFSESTQRAFVKVLLGELEPSAKNPVNLKGFFEREME